MSMCRACTYALYKIQISHSLSKLESILLRILPATAPPKPQLLIIEWTYSEMILTKLSLLLPAVHQHCWIIRGTWHWFYQSTMSQLFKFTLSREDRQQCNWMLLWAKTPYRKERSAYCMQYCEDCNEQLRKWPIWAIIYRFWRLGGSLVTEIRTHLLTTTVQDVPSLRFPLQTA
jgi:hypothetical protein